MWYDKASLYADDQWRRGMTVRDLHETSNPHVRGRRYGTSTATATPSRDDKLENIAIVFGLMYN